LLQKFESTIFLIGPVIFIMTFLEGTIFMAKIIAFPSKKDFIKQFKGKIHDDILNHMSAAYDRVKTLCDQAPSVEIPSSPGFEENIIEFKENYRNYILLLSKRILELEAELCLSKRKT
jgi:hypothetical protein